MPTPLYDPFPKYLQIRDILLRRFAGLAEGTRLPTEADLSAEFMVSRVTIRNVLNTLAEEGVIARRPRLGTYLLKPPPPPLDDRLTGPIEDMTALGLPAWTQAIDHGFVPAAADVAAALGLAAAVEIYRVRRVRFLSGGPLLVLEAFFPEDIGHLLAGHRREGSLFVPILQELLGNDVREDYQQIDALTASAEMAQHLQIDPGAAVLCVKRLFVDGAGRAIAYFKTNFRADRYFYSIKLPKPAPGSGSRRQPPNGTNRPSPERF
ncbi:GntR family transcriptional regulator [Acuticoccus mangrovi]|uniref:GntR family transcriptional regulator n=1 Tax=Acuticoccus mangrovi TaxID=2796142 RepID=A0A934IR10_9HYPH|nr:GntR family transcriptional regulator [Acuticoccus mangrovi]MBJ3776475.1 GntR family transcriptional regulator [Acuticoccus mangrovi]